MPQRQASMTLYLSSLWAGEEMKGLQEDKNTGKGKTGGKDGTLKIWTRAQRHYNECEKSGAVHWVQWVQMLRKLLASNATKDSEIIVIRYFPTNYY